MENEKKVTEIEFYDEYAEVVDYLDIAELGGVMALGYKDQPLAIREGTLMGNHIK